MFVSIKCWIYMFYKYFEKIDKWYVGFDSFLKGKKYI